MRSFNRPTLLAVFGGVLACSACSDVTNVDAADVVVPDALANAAGAQVLRAGAVGRFASSFGGFFGQIMHSGAIADELWSTHPVSTYSNGDRRDDPNASGAYVSLHVARIAALEAVRALQAYAPAPAGPIGHMFAVAGYVELLLAEGYCSGIPLGQIVDQRPVYGVPLTTTQLLERAVRDFDSTLVYSAADQRFADLARVGRARALLNLARYADAAATVSGVPTTYSLPIEYSATVTANGFVAGGFVTVADREGGNGLNFRSANDPRVPTRLAGTSNGFDVYVFTTYSSAASPILLASGIEARLIEAEAHLAAGDAARALGVLNQLRASAISPAMAPLAFEGSAAAQVDQIFRERAFWLFGTGHRHGDLRRLVRQYGRQAEAVFPTGLNKPDTPYGTEVTFAPDARALFNPSFTGCLNRGA